MTNKTDKHEQAYDDIQIRSQVIMELLQLDGVPLDALTGMSLTSLGIELMADDFGLEQTAKILENWAHNVRHDIKMGKKV